MLARFVARRSVPFPVGEGVRIGSEPGEADVTVVIPAYRHERFITIALRSVLGQTYSGFRLLVVDDASPDATVAVARSLKDPRIQIVVNRENLGLGASLQSALESVTTPFVALLNSDDFFHPERLARCRAVLVEDNETAVVATGVVMVDRRGRTLTAENVSRLRDGPRTYHWMRWYGSIQASVRGPDPLFFRLLKHNFLLTSSNIVTRTDYLRDRLAELPGLRYCLDWHLFLSAARTNRLRVLAEPLVAYRLHGRNTVWLASGDRTAYTREVERVAASEVRALLTSEREPDQPALEMLSRAIAYRHAHTELDGHAVVRRAIPPQLAESSSLPSRLAALGWNAPPGAR